MISFMEIPIISTLLVLESVFSFSKTRDRFDDSFLRHFTKQRGTSGRFQAKNILNIRSAKDRLKAELLQQSANMSSRFRCERRSNVHFYSFNVRFLILNVHFFRCFERAADAQRPVMERMVLVQQQIPQKILRALRIHIRKARALQRQRCGSRGAQG